MLISESHEAPALANASGYVCSIASLGCQRHCPTSFVDSESSGDSFMLISRTAASRCWLALTMFWGLACCEGNLLAEVKTWDGKHSIDQIEVTVVYFVPRDRSPLPDWKERVSYFCRRIERFHEREFQGQSVLKTVMRPEPFRSARSTEQLRDGNADFIFFQTLGEVDGELSFGKGERTAFPILLVLSDINWRPLDDFFRLKTSDNGKLEFEGNYTNSRHFPGAASGGAR